MGTKAKVRGDHPVQLACKSGTFGCDAEPGLNLPETHIYTTLMKMLVSAAASTTQAHEPTMSAPQSEGRGVDYSSIPLCILVFARWLRVRHCNPQPRRSTLIPFDSPSRFSVTVTGPKVEVTGMVPKVEDTRPAQTRAKPLRHV